MYAQLGDIKFQALYGPSTLDSSIEATIAEHPLIEGKPRLQRVGTGLETFDLTIKLHVTFCDPATEIAKLRSYLESGEVLPFIGGDGTVYGTFVVKSLGRSVRQLSRIGKIVDAEISVSLLESFDANRLATLNAQAKEQGFANSVNDPLQAQEFTAPQSEAVQASANIVESAAAAEAAATTWNSIVSNAGIYKAKVIGIRDQVTGIVQKCNAAVSIIDGAPGSELFNRTRQLSTDLGLVVTDGNDLITQCNNLITQIDANNTPGVVAAIPLVTAEVAALGSAFNAVSSSIAGLAAMVASKK